MKISQIMDTLIKIYANVGDDIDCYLEDYEQGLWEIKEVVSDEFRSIKKKVVIFKGE